MSVSATGPSIDSIINNMGSSAYIGINEDNKINKSSLKVAREKVKDQREEKIQNLKDQLKGVSQGKCFKAIRCIFKVVDLLAKPISMITGNQIKLQLTKMMDTLAEAKKQGRMASLNIDYQKISQFIESLKKTISSDQQSIKNNLSIQQDDTNRILKILDEIDSTMKTIQQQH